MRHPPKLTCVVSLAFLSLAGCDKPTSNKSGESAPAAKQQEQARGEVPGEEPGEEEEDRGGASVPSLAKSKPRAGKDARKAKLSGDPAQLTKSISAATAATAKLPRPKACARPFDYGQWLDGYLLAAGKSNAAKAGAALVRLHDHLDCVSTREFASFHQALFDHALASQDLFDKPRLDPLEEALVPVVLMIHDMGGRSVDASYRIWLREHAAPIYASMRKGKLAKLPLAVELGANLRELTAKEALLVGKSLATGLSPRCSLAEMLALGGGKGLVCAHDCRSPDEAALRGKTKGKTLATRASSPACRAVGEVAETLDEPGLDKSMRACLEHYIAATKNQDLAVCISTELIAHKNEKTRSLEFEPTVVARVSDACKVSGAPASCNPPSDDDAADNPKLWLVYQACLQDVIEAMNDPEEIEKVEDQQREAWHNYWDIVLDDTSGGSDGSDGSGGSKGSDGGGGSEYCAADIQSCPDDCGIDSYTLQVFESCWESTHGERKRPRAPDPIDPMGPELDPDSPLGQLASCIEEAGAKQLGKGKGDDCGQVLRCYDGSKAREVDGVCTCKGEGGKVPNQRTCEQVIECLPDQPCSCEGAPLDGPIIRDPAGPQPDPMTLVRLAPG